MREIIHCNDLRSNCRFSLCDCFIEKISVNSDSIVFVFSEGFIVINGTYIRHSHAGQVRMLGLEPDDLSCWIMKRHSTKRGAKLCGKPISIEKLSQYLDRKKLKIELFAEMYEAYRLHWRGAFYPSEHRRLNTHVVIETISDSDIELEYTWD